MRWYCPRANASRGRLLVSKSYHIASQLSRGTQRTGGSPAGTPCLKFWFEARNLLDLDLGAGLFQLLLDVLGVGLGSLLLDSLGSAVDDSLGLLQAQAGD